MAVQHMQNVWQRDIYFEKPNLQARGDPTDTTAGIGQQYDAKINLHFPCKESQFEGVGSDGSLIPETPDKFAKVTEGNITYKNMSQRQSNVKMMNDAYVRQTVEQLNKNPMFSKPDDGEKSNESKARAVEMKNPEFILSKVNDAKVEKALDNTNSIRREWMTDSGMGVFDFNPEEANQVKMVVDSNANFVAKRDRFFIQEQGGTAVRGAVAAEKTFKLLEQWDMEAKAATPSIPTRGKTTGSRRKF
jgi:hypothetical protein